MQLLEPPLVDETLLDQEAGEVAQAIALRLGLVRPVTGYVATEAAPAIETAATAFGTGLRDAGFGAPGVGGTVVRVKCRNCGYLETEDAEFCSKCGQRL